MQKADSDKHGDDPNDSAKLLLEAWKQTVAVQQHFNDIELRIRNYAITLLGALFGVVAYAFKEHAPWMIVEGLLFASLILCYTFYFMDRHSYHRLLIGAVKHGQSIEERAPSELGLTKAIGDASPVKLWWWRKRKSRPDDKMHSDDKIMAFYGFIAVAIIVLIVLVFLLSPERGNSNGVSTSRNEQPLSATGSASARSSRLRATATPLTETPQSPAPHH